MTISSSTNKTAIFTTPGTGPFPFTFKVFQEEDIVCVLVNADNLETTLTLATDYTVALNADQNVSPGGEVTLINPLVSGYGLLVMRIVVPLQGLDLITGGAFYPESIENQLDLEVMAAQQALEQLDRALKLPVTSTQTADEFVADIVTNSVDAAAAAAAAELALDEFTDLYLGPKTADPTTDNDGDALQVGAFYYNSVSGVLRIYNSALAWQDAVGAATVGATYNIFSGNGSQTAFTLTAAPSSTQITEAFIAGLRKIPVTDYTVSGTTITFTVAPASGTNNILVFFTSALAAGVPGDGTVTIPKFTTNLFKDEDNMASNSATSICSQQSIKAYADSKNIATQVAPTTSGNLLVTLNGTSWVTGPRPVLMAEQATTSGTQFDFTGIPSWATEITIALNGVSLSGTDAPLIQIGDAGGLENTGYVSTSNEASLSAVGGMSSTTGFVIRSVVATNAVSGVCTLMKVGGTTWVFSGTGRNSSTNSWLAGGTKTLSATLTRFALLATGANTFDGGSISASYM